MKFSVLRLRQWRYWLLIAVLAVNGTSVFAKTPFFALPVAPTQEHVTQHSYLAPNELFPAKSRKILNQVGSGVYVTVGTERAIFAAILAEKISQVLVIDGDPAVIRFHKINRFLVLAAKRDRRKYLHLRFDATFAEWLAQPLEETPNPEDFAFWQSKVRDNPDFLAFDRRVSASRADSLAWRDLELLFAGDPTMARPQEGDLSVYADRLKTRVKQMSDRKKRGLVRQLLRSIEKAEFASGEQPFTGVNYLEDDQAFARISKLIEEGNFAAILGNVFDQNYMGQVVSRLKSSARYVSAIDLSNVWDRNYDQWVKADDFASLMNTFSSVSGWRALLLFTNLQQDGRYLGFSFNQIAFTPAKRKALADLIKVQDWIGPYFEDPRSHNDATGTILDGLHALGFDVDSRFRRTLPYTGDAGSINFAPVSSCDEDLAPSSSVRSSKWRRWLRWSSP